MYVLLDLYILLFEFSVFVTKLCTVCLIDGKRILLLLDYICDIVYLFW